MLAISGDPASAIAATKQSAVVPLDPDEVTISTTDCIAGDPTSRRRHVRGGPDERSGAIRLRQFAHHREQRPSFYRAPDSVRAGVLSAGCSSNIGD